jgi:hypothetical protein
VYRLSCGTTLEDMRQSEGLWVMLRIAVQWRNMAVVYMLTSGNISLFLILGSVGGSGHHTGTNSGELCANDLQERRQMKDRAMCSWCDGLLWKL